MRAGLCALLAALPCCTTATAPPPVAGDHYLERVAFHYPGGNEHLLKRWPDRKMPLRVHLPPPPPGMFEEPAAIHDSVLDGVMDWAEAASPGVPRFRLVDEIGDADIRVVWAEEPDGDWYIAHCAYQYTTVRTQFAVEHILVTARWGDGRLAELHDLYLVMLHEMGHALGLGGHSDDPGDIMYPTIDRSRTSLSARDRNTLRLLYARPPGSRIRGARRGR
ncbi:MAG: matrixin family metalloprotease [Myxococcota bacterium]|nr:matrixin family metalloprotease [Myxococcota bacterium]